MKTVALAALLTSAAVVWTPAFADPSIIVSTKARQHACPLSFSDKNWLSPEILRGIVARSLPGADRILVGLASEVPGMLQFSGVDASLIALIEDMRSKLVELGRSGDARFSSLAPREALLPYLLCLGTGPSCQVQHHLSGQRSQLSFLPLNYVLVPAEDLAKDSPPGAVLAKKPVPGNVSASEKGLASYRYIILATPKPQTGPAASAEDAAEWVGNWAREVTMEAEMNHLSDWVHSNLQRPLIEQDRLFVTHTRIVDMITGTYPNAKASTLVFIDEAFVDLYLIPRSYQAWLDATEVAYRYQLDRLGITLATNRPEVERRIREAALAALGRHSTPEKLAKMGINVKNVLEARFDAQRQRRF